MDEIKNKDGKVTSYREKVYPTNGGNPISKCFPNKTLAKQWKTKFLRDRDLGVLDIKKYAPISFTNVADTWLQKASPDLTPKTIRNYKSVIKVHLNEYFGDCKISSITSDAVDTFRTDLIESEYSPESINKTM